MLLTSADAPLLLGVQEAADKCGISRRLLIKYIETGELTSVKIGRRRLIPVQALHDFIASRVESR